MRAIKFVCFAIIFLNSNAVESRGVRKRKLPDQSHDYEASGDYFEVTVKDFEPELSTQATTKRADSDEVSSDDGVTCSASNFTQIVAGYELENHVLVIFKVNVTANEHELVL